MEDQEKIPGNQNNIPSVAIFASGAGTNAQRIIKYVNEQVLSGKSPDFKVALIVCNKPGAGVIKVAGANMIPLLLIEKDRFSKDAYLPELRHYQIDFIVLAGFLWLIPVPLINAFHHKIINIHPALLPAFGGKGMYGNRVHESVLASGVAQTGISIHYVDDVYDHGEVIFQKSFPIEDSDTVEIIAQKVHELEHQYYPGIIAKFVRPR